MMAVFIFLNTGFATATVNIINLTDIEKHWIKNDKEDLYLLQHLGIFQGYSDGTFKPANQITREEFTKILVVALGEELTVPEKADSFKDVPSNRWSHGFIEKAVEEGIISPKEYSGYFNPKAPITRQEMAIMIVRALGLAPQIITNKEKTIFLDDAKIPLWAKPYINFASEKGIITGYTTSKGSEFKPSQTAARAEAALMLVRFLDQKTKLKETAFYAIDSYKQMEYTEYFNETIFGWSALELGEDGKIKFTMNSKESRHRLPQDYTEPLEFAKEKNVDQKLMLTDTRTHLIYPLLEDKENQGEVINSVVNSLQQYGFTGIVMDLENIRNGEKGYQSAYTSFLKDLKVALTPYGYTLSVAVQPKNVIGYFDGYDYEGIGNFADEIILMAHDYHDSKDTTILTDHAPFIRVHGALKVMLDEGVDPNKIILGLQMAGGTQIRQTVYGSRSFYTPPFSSIYRALDEKEGVVTFDYITMTPNFYYKDPDQNENWIKYENQKSIQSKLRLAKFYGIKGVSVWRIGEMPVEILELFQ